MLNLSACFALISASIPLRDESTFPIAAHFAAFATQIDACFAQRRTVLVHCRAGNSRAAALVIAYVMMRSSLDSPISVDGIPNINGSQTDSAVSTSGVSADANDTNPHQNRLPTSLRDALIFVKSRRPTVSLNEGFVHALIALESSLIAAHHAPSASSLSSLTDHAIVSQPPSPSISPALVRIAHAGGGAVLSAALSASPPLRVTLAALAPVAAAVASRFAACVRSLQSGLAASALSAASAPPSSLAITESSSLSLSAPLAGFGGHINGSDSAYRDRGTLVISDASSALPSGFETRARAPVLGVGMSTFCHGSVDADDSDEWDGDGGSDEDEDGDEEDEEDEEDEDEEEEDARRSALYAGRSVKNRAEGEGARGSDDDDDDDDDNLERYARGDDSDADSFADEENDNEEDDSGRAYGEYQQQHTGSLGFASHRRPELLSAAAAPASTSSLPPFVESDFSEQALTARLQQRLAAASSSADFATLSLRRSGDASSSSSALGSSSSPSSLSSLLASAASASSAAASASSATSAGLRSARPAVAAALAAARAQSAATAAPFVNASESMGSMPPAPVRDVVTLPKLYGSRQ